MGNPGLGPVFQSQVFCCSLRIFRASQSVALDFSFHISNVSRLGLMRVGVPSSANRL